MPRHPGYPVSAGAVLRMHRFALPVIGDVKRPISPLEHCIFGTIASFSGYETLFCRDVRRQASPRPLRRKCHDGYRTKIGLKSSHLMKFKLFRDNVARDVRAQAGTVDCFQTDNLGPWRVGEGGTAASEGRNSRATLQSAGMALRPGLDPEQFRHFSRVAHDPCLVRTATKTPGTPSRRSWRSECHLDQGVPPCHGLRILCCPLRWAWH